MKGLSEHFPQFSCRNLAITRHEHGTVACPLFIMVTTDNRITHLVIQASIKTARQCIKMFEIKSIVVNLWLMTVTKYQRVYLVSIVSGGGGERMANGIGRKLNLTKKLRKFIYLEWLSWSTCISKYLSCTIFFTTKLLSFNIEQLIVKRNFKSFFVLLHLWLVFLSLKLPVHSSLLLSYVVARKDVARSSVEHSSTRHDNEAGKSRSKHVFQHSIQIR